jgi:hypothetical protein
MAGIDDDDRAALPGSSVADGLAVRGENVTGAGEEIDAWLRANRIREDH